MTTNSFLMRFAGSNLVQLFSTEFACHLTGTRLKCIRGKTSGAYRDAGTFQWSSAVRALSLLILDCKIASSTGAIADPFVGEDGSLASSLDYAISKETNWLADMFGYDANGRLLAKRLFHRTNSNRRRPGPVAIAINHRILSPDLIRIEFGNIEMIQVSELNSLRRDLIRYQPSKKEVAPARLTLAA